MADSERVERLLSVTRAEFRAPPGARARVRAGLQAQGELAEKTAGNSPAARLPGAGMAQSTAAVLAGLTFVAGYWLGVQRVTPGEPPPLPVARVAAAPEPPLAPTATRPALPEPEPRPAPARPRATHNDAKPRARINEDAFGDELTLLQRAERALRAGTPELALSFLDELEQRYPKTRFVEERTAARLMARCASGEADARANAELFLRDRRTSVYSDRVRELCGLASEVPADGNGSAGH
ncbi:MAG TPA: hypothetical protein VFS67_35310 [Polyangiaceae bacterium]|nr:hypothetical protein [Polyangiaceae bacterium]